MTKGEVHHCLNIRQEEDVKLQKAIREVSMGECVIMGDFTHGHMHWINERNKLSNDCVTAKSVNIKKVELANIR